jgi:hypothetical protein
MVVLMDESMEATIALSCFTYFWVSRKLDCKVLKRALGIQGFYRQGFSLCYSSLIYVWGPTIVLNPISQGTN